MPNIIITINYHSFSAKTSKLLIIQTGNPTKLEAHDPLISKGSIQLSRQVIDSQARNQENSFVLQDRNRGQFFY